MACTFDARASAVRVGGFPRLRAVGIRLKRVKNESFQLFESYAGPVFGPKEQNWGKSVRCGKKMQQQLMSQMLRDTSAGAHGCRAAQAAEENSAGAEAYGDYGD